MMPTWLATEATAQGRSGRMFFFIEMSTMMGISV